MNDALLSVRSVTLRRGGRTLLRDLSFELKPGRLLAVLGPNGAGKSSLLKGILGLLPLEGGEIFVGDRALESLSASERAKAVAYVPQQSELGIGLTVESVVRMGRFAHRGYHWNGRAPGAAERDDDAVSRALAQCDLTRLASRPFSALSGGERGRVLLARALATEAPLLLLDEPTHSLDVRHTVECLRNLRRLADSGKAVLLVTHDLNQLEGFVDEVLLMSGGRRVALDAPAALLQTPLFESVFGIRLLPRAAYGFDPLFREGALDG
ncbi:MAG: ABC transporter ATP-binding protein [Polyangiaceae bacterium]